MPNVNPKLPSYNYISPGLPFWIYAEPPLGSRSEPRDARQESDGIGSRLEGKFDDIYCKRARTMLSVDDLVVGLVEVV